MNTQELKRLEVDLRRVEHEYDVYDLVYRKVVESTHNVGGSKLKDCTTMNFQHMFKE